MTGDVSDRRCVWRLCVAALKSLVLACLCCDHMGSGDPALPLRRAGGSGFVCLPVAIDVAAFQLMSLCFSANLILFSHPSSLISPGVAGQCSASLLLEYQSNTHQYQLNTHQTPSQVCPPPHLVSFVCILVGQQNHLDIEYDFCCCCCSCCCPYILYTHVFEALVK